MSFAYVQTAVILLSVDDWPDVKLPIYVLFYCMWRISCHFMGIPANLLLVPGAPSTYFNKRRYDSKVFCSIVLHYGIKGNNVDIVRHECFFFANKLHTFVMINFLKCLYFVII